MSVYDTFINTVLNIDTKDNVDRYATLASKLFRPMNISNLDTYKDYVIKYILIQECFKFLKELQNSNDPIIREYMADEFIDAYIHLINYGYGYYGMDPSMTLNHLPTNYNNIDHIISHINDLHDNTIAMIDWN